jgi:hypothetical protein
MDSLYDLLGNKSYDEPPEIAAIKGYVRSMYNAPCNVSVRDNDIVVQVTSAALAGKLRFDMQNLRAAAETDKKIILRIR